MKDKILLIENLLDKVNEMIIGGLHLSQSLTRNECEWFWIYLISSNKLFHSRVSNVPEIIQVIPGWRLSGLFVVLVSLIDYFESAYTCK